MKTRYFFSILLCSLFGVTAQSHASSSELAPIELASIMSSEDMRAMCNKQADIYLSKVACPETEDKKIWIDWLQENIDSIQKYHDGDCSLKPRMLRTLDSERAFAIIGWRLGHDYQARSYCYFALLSEELMVSCIRKKIGCRLTDFQAWENSSWDINLVSKAEYDSRFAVVSFDEIEEILLSVAKEFAKTVLEKIQLAASSSL